MRKIDKYLLIFLLIIAFSCSKKEAETVKPGPVKCAQSTILNELLSGKQMYLLASVNSGKVLLNIKDQKAKARTFGSTAVNAILYEWDIEVKKESDTQVKLIAGDIIAVRGLFVAGVYFPDSFIFNDDKCKITVETTDGQLPTNRLSSYEDITNSKDLPSILEKYQW